MEHKLTVGLMQSTIDFYRNKYPNSPGAKLSDEELIEEIRRWVADEVNGAVIDALLYYEEPDEEE
jgi:hypothetical protein